MNNKTQQKRGIIQNLFEKVYFNFIYNSMRNKFFFKLCLILEIIPLFIILDEIIFIKTTNHLFTFLYFLSSGIWVRLIENKFSFQIIIPDKYIIEKNKQLKDLYANYTNNKNLLLKDYIDKYLKTQKNSIFTSCMNFYLERCSNSNFNDSKLSAFSSNYRIYYDANSISLIFIFAYFLIICFLIWRLKEENFLIINFNRIFSPLLNLFLRTLSFFMYLMIVNKIFDFFYINTYSEIDPNYTIGIKNSINSILIFLFSILIFVSYTVINFLFVSKFSCYDVDYPYDYKSIKYDYMIILMKILGCFLYNFQKYSCVLGQLHKVFNISCLLFIIIILFSGVVFAIKFYKFSSFSNSNKDRCLLIYYLNTFLVYKVLEYSFNLYDISLNYISFFSYLLISFLIYQYSKNKLNYNFFRSYDKLNKPFDICSANYFINLLKNLFNRKNDSKNLNGLKLNELGKQSKLRTIMKDLMRLTIQYLNILENNDIMDEKYYNFFANLLKYVTLHKFLCLNTFKKDIKTSDEFYYSSNNNNLKNILKSIKKLTHSKKNVSKLISNTFKSTTTIKAKKKDNNKNNFLYIKYKKNLLEKEKDDINKNDVCKICEGNVFLEKHLISNLYNLNITEINDIIINYLNRLSKNLYSNLKGYIHYEIFRIMLYYINCHNNKIDKDLRDIRVLFDLHRNTTIIKKTYNKQNFNLFIYHKKKIYLNKHAEFQNINIKKINNYELNYEFQKLSESLKDNLEILRGNVKVDLLISIANENYKFKNKIKSLILASTLDTNNKSNQEFFMKFHYLYIFNTISKKLNITEINLDIIDLVEEDFENNNNLLFEFDPIQRNFIFKSVNSDFLSELKYEFDDLKDENFSKIFPYYLENEQLNKILLFMENEVKEGLFLKFLIQDADKNIKFMQFSFKILINLNLKIYLVAKYKNLDYVEGDIVSQKIYQPQNLLILHEDGWIISHSLNFKKEYLNDEKLIKNFFDLLNIEGEIFLDLFFNRKYCGKYVNLKKIKNEELSENIIYTTNKYGIMLADYYENEIREFLKRKKEKVNKQDKKSDNLSENSKNNIFDLNKASSNAVDDSFRLDEEKSNEQIKTQNFNNTSEKNKKNTRQKFIEVKMNEFFKSDTVNEVKIKIISSQNLKILVEDIITYQDNLYFIFNFEKIKSKVEFLSNFKNFNNNNKINTKITNEITK